MPMLYVTKADGRRQPFERQKIMRTCMRMGADQQTAENIVNQIEQRAYDGIPTKKIIKMIFSYMRRYQPKFKHMIDLRKAVCLMRPKPDFELFVAQLLKEHGYKVKTNRYVNGECIDHEIDVIAEKTVKDKRGHSVKEVVHVEVKHHYKPHTYTGLGVFLETRASFEDLVNGYKTGANKIPFTAAMVVSNTKLSSHAKRYSKCAKIKGIAWKMPADYGLEQMISEKKMYPITLLRGLDPETQAKFGDAGIFTLKQLLERSDVELHSIMKVNKKTIRELQGKAREILNKK